MFYSVQICRAVAALLVVFFHSGGQLAKERYFGGEAALLEAVCWFGGEAGVAFFFVLSGFIIHHTHHRDFDRPEALPSYLLKRIVRIYPTYILVFLAVYSLASILRMGGTAFELDASVLLKSLMLLPQDPAVVGGTGSPVLVVAWSLQYELVFYAVFALALIRRWLFHLAIALFALNFIANAWWGSDHFLERFFGSHLFLLFGLGLLASHLQQSRLRCAHAGALSLAFGLAFVVLAVVVTLNRAHHEKWISDLAYGIVSAGLIVALARYEKQGGTVIGKRIAGSLGDMSYALYLIHFPLISLLSKLAVAVLPINALGATLAFVGLVVTSVLVAWVFNVAVERPMIRSLMSRSPSASVHRA